jgi:hypothetical protein
MRCGAFNRIAKEADVLDLGHDRLETGVHPDGMGIDAVQSRIEPIHHLPELLRGEMLSGGIDLENIEMARPKGTLEDAGKRGPGGLVNVDDGDHPTTSAWKQDQLSNSTSEVRCRSPLQESL